jgi:hypothetical protein
MVIVAACFASGISLPEKSETRIGLRAIVGLLLEGYFQGGNSMSLITSIHAVVEHPTSDNDRRIARRERITELYRSVWNPVNPGGPLPLTPDDHIFHMCGWLELGHRPETLPAVVEMRALFVRIGEPGDVSAEYASLLREEVEWKQSRRRERDDS